MSTNDPSPKPTIDERLQAVVESLELLTAMHRDHAATVERQQAEADRRWTDRLSKLLTIVKSHERRLDRLEGPR